MANSTLEDPRRLRITRPGDLMACSQSELRWPPGTGVTECSLLPQLLERLETAAYTRLKPWLDIERMFR